MASPYINDGDVNWTRMPFSFKLGADFTNLLQVLAYTLEHSKRLHIEDSGQPAKEAFAELLLTGDDQANPRYFTRPYFSDTSPGGNDAINCYWQFGIDDDIIHPLTRSGVNDGDGLGRVYSEMIESNQQILWMTFGVAEFSNPVTFYRNAIDSSLASVMRQGGGTMAEIGHLAGSLVGFVVTLPFQPFIWIGKLLDFVITKEVSKYYDFKQTMLLYYRFVNSILTHLSVNMGMLGESQFLGINGVDQTHNTYTPRFMSKYGPDIFAIMQMRAKRADPNYLITTTEEALQQLNKAPKFFDEFISAFKGAALGAGDYIGFRIEKSVDSSESFSNQTGESSLAATLNGQTASANESSFNTSGLIGDMKSFLAGVADAVSMGGAAAALMGTAFIDIPEVWKGSSFGKSHSVTFKLRSPYGDPVSIMQSIYLPLALILAGALPRATGKNSYSSPFLCRCYCKGMFSIPMGIIESLNITRGDSEFGWSSNQLPTVVNVSLSIKDLSPAMYMSMHADKWSDIFGQNSSFQEYLLTLSGMGLNERVLYLKNLKRKWKILTRIKRSTGIAGLLFGGANPDFWGATVGNLRLIRGLGALNPTTYVRSN